MFEAVLTATGAKLESALLSPSMPLMLEPHAATIPLEHSARLCTPKTPPVLLPSCPKSPQPQAATVPSEHSAKLWKAPATLRNQLITGQYRPPWPDNTAPSLYL